MTRDERTQVIDIVKNAVRETLEAYSECQMCPEKADIDNAVKNCEAYAVERLDLYKEKQRLIKACKSMREHVGLYIVN